MNKAVFLDRDGVINDGSAYYTYTPEQFIFNKDISTALKLLQDNFFKLIIITNQSGIAKGIYTIQDVEKTHSYMKTELEKCGVEITGVYFCPHHPDVSICNCRKPQNGLLLNAIAQHNIDITRSFLIGDSWSDIEAANKTGIKPFKINKNESILSICNEIITTK